MNGLMVVLRLIHIGTGVFWAGTLFFMASFLEPSVRAAGPEGGKVMMQLFARGFLNKLPITAVLSILSGAWLLWIASAGFDPAWMGSRAGIALSTGALTALIGFTIGVAVMRPAALRVYAIMQAMPAITDESTRAARAAEAQVHRQRAATAGRAVAGLLGITVAAMATARYL
jgi:hypothetical protein